MASQSSVATLQQEDKRYNLDLNQSYTVEQIARMFQVTPPGIWVKETFRSRVSEDGVFDLENEELKHFDVEGVSILNIPSSNSTTATTVFSSPSTVSSYPGFTSIIRSSQLRDRKSIQNTTLKVVQATIIGSQNIGQVFLDIVEATANIFNINCLVKKRIWRRACCGDC